MLSRDRWGGLVAMASILGLMVAACFGGSQHSTQTSPPPATVTRTLSIGDEKTTVEMPAEEAAWVDKRIHEEREYASAIAKCQFWRAVQFPLVKPVHGQPLRVEYVERAVDGWCTRAMQDCPKAVEGEGFSISYELANFRERNARMGTRNAREKTSDIKIVAIPGATAEIGRANEKSGGLYGTMPKGETIFAVRGGEEYTVTVYWNVDDGNWGKETIWSGTIKLPEQVVATLTVNRSLFEGGSQQELARLEREFCPAGTQLKGAPPPKAKLIWCEKENGVKHGPVRAFFGKDKVKVEGRYKDGMMEGRWVVWHENGKKHNESDYSNDKREGTAVQWYDNGQKEKEGPFKHGARVDTWTEWYRDGGKKSSGKYKNDAKEGRWTTWHPNGKTASKGRYKNGVKVDTTWKYWNERGQRVKEPKELEPAEGLPVALSNVRFQVRKFRRAVPSYFLIGNIDVTAKKPLPQYAGLFIKVSCWVQGKRMVDNIRPYKQIDELSPGDTKSLNLDPFGTSFLGGVPSKCEVNVKYGVDFGGKYLKQRLVGIYCLDQSGMSAGACK